MMWAVVPAECDLPGMTCSASTGAPGWLWLVLGVWGAVLVWRWVR